MASTGYGQDTLVNPLAEKFRAERARQDSIAALQDTLPVKAQPVMSPDGLDATVEYGSLDSNYLDNITRKVHLYGDAYVRYKDLSLKADYIVVDLDSSIATAEGLPDSLGIMAGLPQFEMGEESFTAER